MLTEHRPVCILICMQVNTVHCKFVLYMYVHKTVRISQCAHAQVIIYTGTITLNFARVSHEI